MSMCNLQSISTETLRAMQSWQKKIEAKLAKAEATIKRQSGEIAELKSQLAAAASGVGAADLGC